MHSNSLKHEDIDTPVSDVPDDEQSATEHQIVRSHHVEVPPIVDLKRLFPIKSSKGMLCLDQFELRIPYASLLPDIDDSSEPRREMSDPAEPFSLNCEKWNLSPKLMNIGSFGRGLSVDSRMMVLLLECLKMVWQRRNYTVPEARRFQDGDGGLQVNTPLAKNKQPVEEGMLSGMFGMLTKPVSMISMALRRKKLPTSESAEKLPEDRSKLVATTDEETVQEKEPEKAKNEQPGMLSTVFGMLTKPVSMISKALRRKTQTVSEKLLAACRSKTPDINEIRGYLEQEECDVNIREDDEFKWSPLMWACENNNFEIGRLLLKYQPQVNIQDKKEWSPLVLASRAGDLEIVQGIVALGAEIDKPTNRLWTPLKWAAQEGHAAVAEFLLQQGAQVDFLDENEWTPLMQASEEGHIDVVNVLFDYNAKANHQTNTTWCALMAAAKNKHSEVVDTLLKRGAEVDLSKYDGSTALHVASNYKGNSAVVNVLIKHGANVDHQNKDGMTALMLATNKGHLDLVQALINGGADLDKQHPEIGWTAIFFAVKSDNLEIFKELLHKGTKTEIEGTHVADVASMFKWRAIVKELKTFKEAQHRQISGHAPTLEPSPPTTVEQETSKQDLQVDTPLEAIQLPQTSLVQPDITSPLDETSGSEPSQAAGSEVKPEATGPVTTESYQISTRITAKEQSKSEQHSEAKKTSQTDIKRKMEIINLIMKQMDNRMANPKKYISSKGLPSAGVITHREPKGPAQRPIKSSYVKEDSDDDLFS